MLKISEYTLFVNLVTFKNVFFAGHFEKFELVFLSFSPEYLTDTVLNAHFSRLCIILTECKTFRLYWPTGSDLQA